MQVTSDSYVVGAVVLADSLRSTCAAAHKRPMACMVTAEVCTHALEICERGEKESSRVLIEVRRLEHHLHVHV